MQCPMCHRYVDQEYVCPRCKTDLTYLQELKQKAERSFTRGRYYLMINDFDKACEAFRQAYTLYATQEHRQALQVALICSGRYREAFTKQQKSFG